MIELKHCLTCDGQISPNAESCPHCGEPEPVDEHKHRINKLRNQGYKRCRYHIDSFTKKGRLRDLDKLIKEQKVLGHLYDGYKEEDGKILAFFYKPPDNEENGGGGMSVIQFALISTVLAFSGLIGYGAIFAEPPTKQEIAAREKAEAAEAKAAALEEERSDLRSAVSDFCWDYKHLWANYPETINDNFMGIRSTANAKENKAFYAKEFTAENAFGTPSRFTIKCFLDNGDFSATVYTGYILR